jgi:hypothetical protein
MAAGLRPSPRTRPQKFLTTSCHWKSYQRAASAAAGSGSDGGADAVGSQLQRLEPYGGPLLGIPWWYAGVGQTRAREEDTAGDATPSRTSFLVASTCTLGRGLPVSVTSTARARSIATGQRTRRRCSRRSRPNGTSLASPSQACAPGTWLADRGARQGIPCGLGHALSRHAIQGGQATHDTSDAQKMAGLRRGGLLPQADVEPAARRAPRDL